MDAGCLDYLLQHTVLRGNSQQDRVRGFQGDAEQKLCGDMSHIPGLAHYLAHYLNAHTFQGKEKTRTIQI